MELTAEMKAVRDEIVAQINQFAGSAKQDIAALRGELANAETKEQLTNLKSQVEQMRAELLRAVPAGQEGSRTVKSFGQLFAEAEEIRQFAKHWRSGGTGLKFEQPLFDRSMKTLIDSTALGSSTPGILVPERIGGIVGPPMRRTRVRDLIPFSTTQNNAVEFVKENVFTNAASPQVEGSDKGESALTFLIAYANVQTLAHWIPATRQALDDLAQLQSYIDTRLLAGLADLEDAELLRGDGTGVHLNGIQTQATAVAGTYAAAGDTAIDLVCNAITELEDSDYVADGLVVHPSDWRKMTKIKTDDGGANKGMYLLGGPGSSAAPRLWDLPVVRTTAQSKGTFLVGQFSGSVQGYDRMQSGIDVSNSHSDYFVKNKVAIRAEERITVAVFRPAAFRRGTF